MKWVILVIALAGLLGCVATVVWMMRRRPESQVGATFLEQFVSSRRQACLHAERAFELCYLLVSIGFVLLVIGALTAYERPGGEGVLAAVTGTLCEFLGASCFILYSKAIRRVEVQDEVIVDALRTSHLVERQLRPESRGADSGQAGGAIDSARQLSTNQEKGALVKTTNV